MPTFSAPDGTRLAFRDSGDGAPVVCLPGGPTDSGYLGNLGGLSGHRRLIGLDPRGTGGSAIPEDTTSYRCDRLVDDVEALRAHLGLERVDLLAHCAGANTAVQYVTRYPERVGSLVLVTPSTRAVGITITTRTRRGTARLRRDEPWFPAAFTALEAVFAGEAGDGDEEAIAPFFHGRWDDAARELQAASRPDNDEAVGLFGSDGAFDPEATRAGLAAHRGPVLLLAGEFDLNTPPASTAEFAGLFPSAELVVRPGAGHYPWLDDADRFVATAAAFLG
ncbi:alpha/beta hydrolase [Streptomyces sp. SL13]|uniref:Alpha/beta hydrolase n=1 Tax=Streptantibioticus silvisoli TaxID=2705255 RepID=A0AA90K100_9ACTN|nr:alpha/beta hydrolase [Streptantibioticus silvisoli]MDI5973451.1 alpha/beta hydrolase [Streptantibioticus silvisoli]